MRGRLITDVVVTIKKIVKARFLIFFTTNVAAAARFLQEIGLHERDLRIRVAQQ